MGLNCRHVEKGGGLIAKKRVELRFGQLLKNGAADCRYTPEV